MAGGGGGRCWKSRSFSGVSAVLILTANHASFEGQDLSLKLN